MSNHMPRAGVPPDTNLRAHDMRTCDYCGKVLHTPGKNWRHCGYECRRLARYQRLGKPAPPPRTTPKEKDKPRLPAYQEQPHAWIEARMAWWADFHKRHRTFRVGNGWEGWRSSLGGGDS